MFKPTIEELQGLGFEDSPHCCFYHIPSLEELKSFINIFKERKIMTPEQLAEKIFNTSFNQKGLEQIIKKYTEQFVTREEACEFANEYLESIEGFIGTAGNTELDIFLNKFRKEKTKK